jgi:integrase
MDTLANLLERSEVRKVRFHDLRHTCATLLLSKNVNSKAVSEMLGHANVTVTLDTYSHVLPHMQDGAVDVMESSLSWRALSSNCRQEAQYLD